MAIDDHETHRRRARLRELFAVFGKQADLVLHIKTRTGKTPNQGEMSALAKDDGGKSFGDKKARRLTEQVGLPRTWFSMPLGSCLDPKDWPDAILADIAAGNVTPSVNKVTEVLPSANSEGAILYGSSDRAVVRPFVKLFPHVDLHRYLRLEAADRLRVQEAMNDQIRLAEVRATERNAASGKQ